MYFTTNVTFLEKICSGDEVSWEQFKKIYSPLIRSCGFYWKLSPAECDELIQEVMISFFRRSGTFKYDPQRGSFRSYLRTIARNSTFAILRRRSDNVPESEVQNSVMDLAFDEQWDNEWHNHLFSEALKVLERDMDAISFRSFHAYVIEGKKPADVAAMFGISVNAVYINKCRALEHLRRTVKMLDKL